MILSEYLDTASSYAQDVDHLILLIACIVGFWFFAAQAVFLGFLVKFRQRPGVRAQYIAGEDKREKRWVSIPHYAVLVFDVFIIVGAIRVWMEIKQDLPPAQETIRIIAQQWAWTFEHPGPDGKLDTADDIRTVDELHVAKDRTYHFELTSRDVIHSFSVPSFRLKQDAIPGRIIKGWFKPTLTGTFDIQCAEICGIGHGLMPARIHIHTPEAHAEWVKTHASVAAAPAASSSPAPGGTP